MLFTLFRTSEVSSLELCTEVLEAVNVRGLVILTCVGVPSFKLVILDISGSITPMRVPLKSMLVIFEQFVKSSVPCALELFLIVNVARFGMLSNTNTRLSLPDILSSVRVIYVHPSIVIPVMLCRYLNMDSLVSVSIDEICVCEEKSTVPVKLSKCDL